jgi:hypothetical protein
MTRTPPSGQFPTGFVPTTASFCTGCDVRWNGSGLSNGSTTGQPYQGQPGVYFPGIPLSGFGIGSFQNPLNGYANGPMTGTWPAGYPLGNIAFVYNNVRDGRCAPQTGTIFYSGTSGTGVLIYTNLTGCTGTSGCFSQFTPYFYPDSAFFMASGQMTAVFGDYCNSNASFMVFNFPIYDRNGNIRPGSIPSGSGREYVPNIGWPFALGSAGFQACGQDCYYDIQVIYTPVPASGANNVRALSGWRLSCTPCTGSGG